ncbi:MAG: hypothetical protein AABY64_04995 [Bdellovibrionota bacterium]
MKELKAVVFFTLFSVAAMTSGYWMWLVLVLFPMMVFLVAPVLVLINITYSYFSSRPATKQRKVRRLVVSDRLSEKMDEMELTFLPVNF